MWQGPFELEHRNVVITGGATVDTAVEAMHCGARDYIEKPISIPLLVEKIENTPTGPGDRPKTPVQMVRITVNE